MYLCAKPQEFRLLAASITASQHREGKDDLMIDASQPLTGLSKKHNEICCKLLLHSVKNFVILAYPTRKIFLDLITDNF